MIRTLADAWAPVRRPDRRASRFGANAAFRA